MARSGAPSATTGVDRRLLLLTVAFGLFLLCDIALFGWLIFRTMSKREVDRVLLDTRREAESLAQRIAGRVEGREDLYTAIATEQETQTYIDSIPQQRDIVRSVEIRDKSGALVFQSHTQASEVLGGGGGSVIESPELLLGGDVKQETQERSEELTVPDIEVAIGDIGTLVVGISPQQLRRRIEVLRGDLIRNTSAVAVLTLVLLGFAYVLIWWLWRRARHLELAAADAERMAYIGTLASGLAHEIRNPLNSLSLNMQMMQEEIDVGRGRGPTEGRLLSITRSEISRLERLVTDFLSYARPRSPEREEVRPRQLFERVAEVVGGRVTRLGGRLEVEDASHAVLHADVAQLTQLLLNLVGNALEAAEGTGRAPEVRMTARRRDDEVLLEVTDNGPGIAAGDEKRIFDVFYSTRRGGTGLGLAIVERIARNHGGRVEVESTSGAGATFRVILPEAPAGEQ